MKSPKSKVQSPKSPIRPEFGLWPLGPGLLAVFCAVLVSATAPAQAPSILWRTNVGANLFAIDAQTNVYANSGGKVIQMNSVGRPFKTNSICPLSGIAQRDAAGNYLFAGNFDGPINFGGVLLVGGWTNCLNPPCNGPYNWTPGYPTCFLAKYSSNGPPAQWAVSFGQQGTSNFLSDALLDENGGCYVGYIVSGLDKIAHFTSSGSNDWTEFVDGYAHPPNGCTFAFTLGRMTATNCAFFRFLYQCGCNYDSVIVGRPASLDGTLGNYYGYGGVPALTWSSADSFRSRPIFDDSGHWVVAGTCTPYTTGFCPDTCSPNQRLLRKFTNGVVQWSVDLGTAEPWTLASDALSDSYIGDSANGLSMYDTTGALIWSTNYDSKSVRMLIDASGNRFVLFSDGSIARLTGEPPPPPLQLIQPALTGSTFSVSFQSINGRTYTLQSKNSLTDRMWTDVSMLPGDGNVDTFFDFSATSPQRVYRVQQQ